MRRCGNGRCLLVTGTTSVSESLALHPLRGEGMKKLDYIVLRHTGPIVDLRRRTAYYGNAANLQYRNVDLHLLSHAMSQGVHPKDAFTLEQERLTASQAASLSQDESVASCHLA